MIRSFSLPDHEIEEGPLDGGMAHVYIARHVVLGRRVAIKVIRPELVADAGFASRFVREAKIVSRLNHPNVVTLYQVGERQGKPYFVMEYLAGGELKQRIHSSAKVGKTGEAYGAHYACSLSLEEVLRIAKDVASALAAAHEKGYVHRDIKPSNIMFRADNSVVVTDFGIAKAIEPEKTQVDMTVTYGAVIGTPLYMSPEQVDPSQLGVDQVDGRADLYSLGAVIYYTLTGHPPFTAETPFQLGLKHLSASIPKLPPYLKYYQPLIQRCMAKRPADRFASADAFIAEVERLQKTHPRSAIPPDEPLPRFELPWQHDEGTTAKLFDSFNNWVSPTRAVSGLLLIITLLALLFWFASRTKTEDLLSMVETEQRAIDTLLAAPYVDFDKAVAKIDYTENLLKIQPNNPTSSAQLVALLKKMEGAVYDEISESKFEAAKNHITLISKLYPDWKAKKDIESALADSEKQWAQLQDSQRQELLRADILKKIEAALNNHQFEKYEMLVQEAKNMGIADQALAGFELKLAQLKAEELAQQEKVKQERLQVLKQQFNQARQNRNVTAVEASLISLRDAGATESDLQFFQQERQNVLDELAEIAKAQIREKEQARFAQLDAQQATGNLEMQFSVWQSLMTQPLITVPGANVAALKQKIEQRVSQLIRTELKTGHYDVVEIWSNDAKTRGMNLPWAQLQPPAVKEPEAKEPVVKAPEAPTEKQIQPAEAPKPPKHSAPDVTRAVKETAPVASTPIEPAQNTPAAAPKTAEEKRPQTKSRTPTREVQVIGF